MGCLELLQNGVWSARGEDVAGQEEHGQAVYRGEGRSRNHVGGAGTYGGSAGEGLEAVFLAGVGRGRVYHRLLVAGLVVRDGSSAYCWSA